MADRRFFVPKGSDSKCEYSPRLLLLEDRRRPAGRDPPAILRTAIGLAKLADRDWRKKRHRALGFIFPAEALEDGVRNDPLGAIFPNDFNKGRREEVAGDAVSVPLAEHGHDRGAADGINTGLAVENAVFGEQRRDL